MDKDNLIASIMAKEGPIVQTVILRSNGEQEQVQVDMTSSKNELSKIMGGQLTIIGQLQVLNAVLLKLDEDEDAVRGLGTNVHKLPHPFHDEEHLGDIILMRMNDDSEPETLTLADWNNFVKTAPYTAEAYEAWCAKHNLEEDEDEDSLAMGAEEAKLTEEETAVLQKIVEALTKKLKAAPEANQIYEELAKNGHMTILDKLLSGDDDDDEEEGDDDDEEDLTKEEEKVIEQVVTALEKKLKTEPTEEQVFDALTKAGQSELVDKLQRMSAAQGSDDDDDEEEEEEDLTEEEEKTLNQVVKQLQKKLKTEPTEEQVFEALAKAGKNELLEKLQRISAAEDGSEDSDDHDDGKEEEEDLTEEEEKALTQVLKQLQKKLKTEPMEEQVFEALAKAGQSELVAKLQRMAAQGSDDESGSSSGDEQKAEDGEDEEDEEEDLTEEEEKVINQVLKQLQKKLKTEPMEEEVFEALAKAGQSELVAKLQRLADAQGSDDESGSSGEEDLTKEERAYLDKLLASLATKLKREPTEEEVFEALAKAGKNAILAKLQSVQDAGDESELTEEETEFLSNLLLKLETAAGGEQPDEEEVFAELARLGRPEIIAKLKAEASMFSDDDSEFGPEDEAFIVSLVEKLSKTLKRAPEEEDIMKALASSKDPQAIKVLEKMMAQDDDDEEDEDDDEDDEEEEEEVKAPQPKKQKLEQKKPQQQQQQQQKKPQQQQQQQQQKKPQQQQSAKQKQQQRGPPPRQGGKQPPNKRAKRG